MYEIFGTANLVISMRVNDEDIEKFGEYSTYQFDMRLVGKENLKLYNALGTCVGEIEVHDEDIEWDEFIKCDESSYEVERLHRENEELRLENERLRNKV